MLSRGERRGRIYCLAAFIATPSWLIASRQRCRLQTAGKAFKWAKGWIVHACYTRMKDFLQRATHTEHIHTDAHTHTAGPSEGTWPLWWNNHFKIDFLWLGQTERDQRVILLEGKTHTLMLFQAIWQAGGLCIILANMSNVPQCDVGFCTSLPGDIIRESPQLQFRPLLSVLFSDHLAKCPLTHPNTHIADVA